MVQKKVVFNQEKFRAAILYIISHSGGQTVEGKKKLAKLLYFADFNFFEAFEEPLTGATYRALPMGPVPQELEKELKSMEGRELLVEKKSIGLKNDLVVYKIASDKKFNFSIFTDAEKKVLDKVVLDYGKMNGKMLEDLTHAEAPFNAVAQGEYMPYELSFYRGKSTEELVGK